MSWSNRDTGDGDPDNVRETSDHRRKARYQFSTEEIRAFRECNRESFYYRSAPLAVPAMLAVHYAVKQGYLKGSAKWGSTGKVIAAGVAGWMIGKISYTKKCEEKILRIPNSQLAEVLRRKRAGHTTQVLDFGKEPYGSFAGQEENKEVAQFQESLPPVTQDALEIPTDLPKSTTNYEDLRKRNREEYSRQAFGVPKQTPSPNPVVRPVVPTTGTDQKKNLYGDVWDD